MEPEAKFEFEPITPDYGWSRFGDFSVLIRKDGYINATKLCKDGGKRFDNWLRLDGAKKIIEEFGSYLNMEPKELVSYVSQSCNELRGTYVHLLIVPHIAMWISPRFAVKISVFLQKWQMMSTENTSEYWYSMLDCVKNHPSACDQEEKKWQTMIAAREGGDMEVVVPDGRIDVLSEFKIIEVKEACGWKHALGQVLIYGRSFKDREKWIALYGDVDQDRVREACAEFGVHVEFLN